VANTALPSVAVIAPVDVHHNVLGPGLRYHAFAEAIGARQPVTLITPGARAPRTERYATATLSDPAAVDAIMKTHGVVVMQGYPLVTQPHLRAAILRERPALAVDLYAPLNLEGLAVHDPVTGQAAAARDLHALLDQLTLGDFFFCASEHQRDYYLGLLAALGRLDLSATFNDPAARRMIDVVPFGCDEQPPTAGPPVVKGAHPAIPADATVMLWFGGLWNWLDGASVVSAFGRIAEAHPNARLVFVSAPADPENPHAARGERAARAASDALGLTDRQIVFFGPVAPERRGALLLESDIGLSYNRDILETRFAFRTRLIDYAWAGLPMITGAGDTLGDRFAALGLADAVPPDDVAGLAAAMTRMLADPARRTRRAEAFASARSALRWSNAVGPLLTFCAAPYRQAYAPRPLAGDVTAEALRQENDQLRHALKAAQDEIAALRDGRVMKALNRVQGVINQARAPKGRP
jgi:glycosyltransferase involved in cell wall biosynthesis